MDRGGAPPIVLVGARGGGINLQPSPFFLSQNSSTWYFSELTGHAHGAERDAPQPVHAALAGAAVSSPGAKLRSLRVRLNGVSFVSVTQVSPRLVFRMPGSSSCSAALSRRSSRGTTRAPEGSTRATSCPSAQRSWSKRAAANAPLAHLSRYALSMPAGCTAVLLCPTRNHTTHTFLIFRTDDAMPAVRP